MFKMKLFSFMKGIRKTCNNVIGLKGTELHLMDVPNCIKLQHYHALKFVYELFVNLT